MTYALFLILGSAILAADSRTDGEKASINPDILDSLLDAAVPTGWNPPAPVYQGHDWTVTNGDR